MGLWPCDAAFGRMPIMNQTMPPQGGLPQGAAHDGAELLLLDPDPLVKTHVSRLAHFFRVTAATSVGSAVEYLRRTPRTCQFVISDVRVNGEDTFDVFRAAKAVSLAPTILVTTADVERVPDALLSGGDAVLLKPFAPNLLFSRLGRLKQERATMLARSRTLASQKEHLLRERTTAALVGKLGIPLPYDHCPHCNAAPITSFDFVSHRRAWYACLSCKKVWIANHL
jgi:CheY-like chemotaxis protein